MKGERLSMQMLDYLVACMCVNESVMLASSNTIDPANFDQVSEKHLAICYEIARDFFKQYRTMPPWEAFFRLVQERLAADEMVLHSQYTMNNLAQLLKLIRDGRSTEVAVPMCLDLLQRFLDERQFLPAYQLSVGTDMTPTSAMSSLNAAFVRSRVARNTAFDPFDSSKSYNTGMENTSPRRPTGQKVIDTLLGGGIRDNDLTLMMGPVGGGKTMLSLLMGISQAKLIPLDSRDIVLFFSVEQPYIPQIRERIWTAVSRADRKVIEGQSMQTIPPDVRKRIETNEAFARLKVVDFSDGVNSAGGVDAIRSTIHQFNAAGTRVRGAYIDWLGVLADHVISAAPQARGGEPSARKRSMMELMVTQLKTLTNIYQMPITVTHQLTVDSAKKSIMYEPSQYDAADAGGLSRMVDNCITLSKIDENSGVLKVVNAKSSRNGGEPMVWAEVDKRRHQMSLSRNEWELSHIRKGVYGYVPVQSSNSSVSIRSTLPLVQLNVDTVV